MVVRISLIHDQIKSKCNFQTIHTSLPKISCPSMVIHSNSYNPFIQALVHIQLSSQGS